MDDEVIPVIEDSDDADLARRIVTAMEAEFQLTMPPIELLISSFTSRAQKSAITTATFGISPATSMNRNSYASSTT